MNPQRSDTRRGGLMRKLSESLLAVVILNALAVPVFGQCFTLENFNADNGGYTRTGNSGFGPWTYGSNAGADGSGAWFTNGPGDPCSSPNRFEALTSPTFTAGGGVVTISFDHRYSFETPNFDGGQLQVSVNGGAFNAVPATSFTANGYNASLIGNHALFAQMAFA